MLSTDWSNFGSSRGDGRRLCAQDAKAARRPVVLLFLHKLPDRRAPIRSERLQQKWSLLRRRNWLAARYGAVRFLAEDSCYRRRAFRFLLLRQTVPPNLCLDREGHVCLAVSIQTLAPDQTQSVSLIARASDRFSPSIQYSFNPARQAARRMKPQTNRLRR
jgi:hypothetical protein